MLSGEFVLRVTRLIFEITSQNDTMEEQKAKAMVRTNEALSDVPVEGVSRRVHELF